MKKKLVGYIIISFMLLFILSFKVNGQEARVVSKEKYIALSIYNFTKMVNWPESMRVKETFTIGIVGSKVLADELIKTTLNRMNGSQKIDIKYFDNAEEISGILHIVFVSKGQTSKYMKIDQKQFENSLIITEKEGMTDFGSAINFIPLDGSIKFELSEKNTKDHNLTLNPRLKTMAVQVN